MLLHRRFVCLLSTFLVEFVCSLGLWFLATAPLISHAPDKLFSILQRNQWLPFLTSSFLKWIEFYVPNVFPFPLPKSSLAYTMSGTGLDVSFPTAPVVSFSFMVAIFDVIYDPPSWILSCPIESPVKRKPSPFLPPPPLTLATCNIPGPTREKRERNQKFEYNHAIMRPTGCTTDCRCSCQSTGRRLASLCCSYWWCA